VTRPATSDFAQTPTRPRSRARPPRSTGAGNINPGRVRIDQRLKRPLRPGVCGEPRWRDTPVPPAARPEARTSRWRPQRHPRRTHQHRQVGPGESWRPLIPRPRARAYGARAWPADLGDTSERAASLLATARPRPRRSRIRPEPAGRRAGCAQLDCLPAERSTRSAALSGTMFTRARGLRRQPSDPERNSVGDGCRGVTRAHNARDAVFAAPRSRRDKAGPPRSVTSAPSSGRTT